jgi:predicted Zn-dependent protease
MLEFLRSWFERRRAQAEINAIERADEAVNHAKFEGRLIEAKAALQGNDRERADEMCTHLLRTYPRTFQKSSATIDLLLGLRRLIEADMLIKQRLRRDPYSLELLSMHARVSEVGDNVQEAVRRWRLVTKRLPYEPVGYIAGAIYLDRLGEPKKAERLLGRGVRRCEAHRGLLLAHAERSMLRNDWQSAIDRFKTAAALAPCASQVGIAKCLAAMGKDDDAEALLAHLVQVYDHEHEPAVEWARLAHHSDRRAEAVVRWKRVQARYPRQGVAQRAAADALRELGDSQPQTL